MTPLEKQKLFQEELMDLLHKHKATLSLQDFGSGYSRFEKIVVEFDFDESLIVEHGTGVIPDLILGTYVC